MIEGKDFDVLDDGFIRRHKDGDPVEHEEAEAENSKLLLSDVLKISPEIPAPSIHSPEIQAILDCRDEPEEKRLARASRLEAIGKLLAEQTTEDDKS